MSYDFAGIRTALSNACNVEGWADQRSARLEGEFLAPLLQNTQAAEALAVEISLFMQDVEYKLDEIARSD